MRRFLEGVFAPVLLFGIVYVGVFVVALFLPVESQAGFHSVGLAAAFIASWVAIRGYDGGRWSLGFGGGLTNAIRELLLGAGLASVLLLISHSLILVTTGFRHSEGIGIDWMQILLLFLPAAVHEEVLLRGYPFQKLIAWHRTAGVVIGSLVFGLLHLSNGGLTTLSIVNLFLAGIMLSLAYLVYERLWLPIGLHVWWNVLSGPLLGHEVSGLDLESTLLEAHDPGPVLLTGGAFGIEGSIWTSVVEAFGIFFLLWVLHRRNRMHLPPAQTGITETGETAGLHRMENE